MGVLAGWVCNKIMVACNSGPGQEWSEYEREHSENGSSDEYSKYHTDSEQTRRLSRKFIPPKQCLVPLEEDDTRSSMGSSTRDSGSLVGNLPSPARFFAQKEKRDAEIQTDTSTTLTKSSRSKKSRAIQSNDQQAPFLYRLMEDESKLKRIHIRRTKGSIKGSNNPPQIISYLPQMTQSSPATLFESFRKERDQQPKKIPGSVQIQRQKSHQLFHYEREGTYLTQQVNQDRSSLHVYLYHICSK